jgi:hypothetical protein
MKKRVLFLCVLLLNVFTFVYAESVIKSTYYFNDFGTAANATKYGTLTCLNPENASYTAEGALKIDVSGAIVHNTPIITIEFSSPLDLSSGIGAWIEIEGKKETIIGNNDADGSPRWYVHLTDVDDRSTGSGASTKDNYTPGNSFSTATLNLRTSPGSNPAGFDFSQIKRLRMSYFGGSYSPLKSGYFHIRKIRLGASLEEEVSSILTSHSFLNEFDDVITQGTTAVWEKNQSSTFSSVTRTQNNGVLDIYAASVLSTWKDFYVTTFAKPIDLSDPNHHKFSLKFTIENLVNPETGTKLGFRIFDESGLNKILEPVLKPGTYDTTFVFTNTYIDGGKTGFDFTKVNKVVIATRNPAPTSTGHIKLDRLLVGADIVPVNITLESFDAGGLTINVDPAAPQMVLTSSFVIKDFTTEEPVTGVTASLLEDGAKFKLTGIQPGKYTLTLDDPLYYSKRSLTFEGAFTTGLSATVADSGVLSIYPNPVVDRLQLSVNAESFGVRIYDAAGTLAGAYEGERNIDVSGLPSGLYSVRVLLPEGGVYNGKFIKK